MNPAVHNFFPYEIIYTFFFVSVFQYEVSKFEMKEFCEKMTI